MTLLKEKLFFFTEGRSKVRSNSAVYFCSILFLKDIFMKVKKGKKGKFFPFCAKKTYTGSRGTNPFILNLGTSWR